MGGLAWALLPAWLKRHAEIDEVVTTLLLNPVALLVVQGLLNGPWRNSSSGFTDSDRFGTGYDLPALVPDSRVHWGFAVALLIIVVTGYVMARTPTGLRIRAAGQSPEGGGVQRHRGGPAAVPCGAASPAPSPGWAARRR